jgi:hypothetical protein
MTILAFFVIFPLGMAISRRYRIAHIAFQATGAFIGLIGIFIGKLGWSGTSWRDGKIQIVISAKYDLSTRIHKGLGWGILTLVVLQSGLLGALKMLIVRWQTTGWSIHIRYYKSMKKIVAEMHKANAWVILGAAYVESAVGVTSLSGTCLWDGVGGCLGHIIAGLSLLLCFFSLSRVSQLTVSSHSLIQAPHSSGTLPFSSSVSSIPNPTATPTPAPKNSGPRSSSPQPASPLSSPLSSPRTLRFPIPYCLSPVGFSV